MPSNLAGAEFMTKYLRTGPIVTEAAGYLQTDKTPFDWVDDLEKATTDYLPAIKATQDALKAQHGIETETLEVAFPAIPQVGSKWAIVKKE
jgi:hypothetical protein